MKKNIERVFFRKLLGNALFMFIGLLLLKICSIIQISWLLVSLPILMVISILALIYGIAISIELYISISQVINRYRK